MLNSWSEVYVQWKAGTMCDYDWYAGITHTLETNEIIAYHQTSDIRRAKSQNLNVSYIVFELYLSNPLKAGVK